MVRLQHADISTRRKLNKLLGLALLLAVGCGRQPNFPVSNQSVVGQLPFDRTSEASGISPTHALASPAIPIGTAIVARPQSPLSSATCHAGDVFQAVLDEPIRLPDKTILQPGTVLTGTVLAAKPSEPPRDPGYLRLTLSTIRLQGKTLHLHTSSIFAKGSAGDGIGGGHPLNVEFSTARRLTFRLVQPLPPPS